MAKKCSEAITLKFYLKPLWNRALVSEYIFLFATNYFRECTSNLHSCTLVENGRAYRVKVGLFAGRYHVSGIALVLNWMTIHGISNTFVFDGIDRLIIWNYIVKKHSRQQLNKNVTNHWIKIKAVSNCILLVVFPSQKRSYFIYRPEKRPWFECALQQTNTGRRSSCALSAK
jgi:hypothetical protein